MHRAEFILIVCSVLFAGCITGASVERDEPVPNDKDVFFYLHDGSHIRSYSGHHQRIECAYNVSGLRFYPGCFPTAFDGELCDVEITRITTDEINWLATLLGIGLVGPIVAGVLVMAAH